MDFSDKSQETFRKIKSQILFLGWFASNLDKNFIDF